MITLLLLSVPTVCSAEIYKWVDEKGQTGFSDDLGKVPKKFRDAAVVEEKQEQAVEILENGQADKGAKKDADAKGEQKKDVRAEQKKDAKGQEKDKEKRTFDGKTGDAWKQDFARQKYQIKSLEEQAAGLKERMASGSKMSRGEYLTLQNTQRDLDVRIGKAKSKLEALSQAADKAELPQEFR